ncbi:MAG: hypothetical protein HY719_06280 [Planctomycetes bacterium]|nr:hypothetical protein [Planctomycetota bacterium]
MAPGLAARRTTWGREEKKRVDFARLRTGEKKMAICHHCQVEVDAGVAVCPACGTGVGGRRGGAGEDQVGGAASASGSADAGGRGGVLRGEERGTRGEGRGAAPPPLARLTRLGILGEFFLFIREEKKWWLVPLVLVLMLFALLLFGANNPLASLFLYPIFGG